MLDLMFYVFGVPAWTVGGTFTAKKAIAVAEGHYLRMSVEANRRDAAVRIQDKMDADDWIGASFFAAGAFVFFPAVAAFWAGKRVLTPFARPVRKFLLPPVQKEFEEHVEAMDNQVALLRSTAHTYRDVLSWQPDDHPDRIAMVHQLQEQIKDQLAELMKMTRPDRSFDGDYLESAKNELKELTAGGI